MSSVFAPVDEFDSVETLADGGVLFVERIFVNDEDLDESLDRPDRITFDQVLAKILDRFWKVECAHRFKLRLLTEMKTALKDVVNRVELECVFNQLENRVVHNSKYYLQLKELKAEERLNPESLCSTVLSCMPLFKLYQTVAAGYQTTVTAAQRIQSLASVAEILNKFNVRLELLLNLNVHRVVRLLMTLVRLYRLHDNFNIAIEPDIMQATMSISNLASEIEGLLAPIKAKGNQLLQTVQRDVFHNRFCVFNSTRYVIRQGKLLKMKRRKLNIIHNVTKCMFMLCNDLILYGALNGDGRTATLSRIIAIGGLSVKPLSATTLLLSSAVIGTITVISSSAEENQQWIDDIRMAIELDAIRRRCLQTKSALQRATLQKPITKPSGE